MVGGTGEVAVAPPPSPREMNKRKMKKIWFKGKSVRDKMNWMKNDDLHYYNNGFCVRDKRFFSADGWPARTLGYGKIAIFRAGIRFSHVDAYVALTEK